MKKIMLLAVTVIIVFCLVPISTALAMQHYKQKQCSLAFDKNEIHNMIVELGNPEFKAKLLTGDRNELNGEIIARGGAGGSGGAGVGGGAGIGGGKSKGSGSRGNNNQNVNRTGHGRSTMGDEYDAARDKNVPGEEEKEDWPEAEWQETEWPKSDWGDAEYPED